jgi:transposase InsO family protein
MAWQERSIMDQRLEFVSLVESGSESVSALCRRFGVSRQTGHKWIRRHRAEGQAGLCDRSRRPLSSPLWCGDTTEQLVRSVRAAHPAWGGRKIRARLLALGHASVPAASTITTILHRHGLISAEASEAATPWTRFEHDRPNDLWQMDFKGPVRLRRGVCHALTVLDDHSRFAVGLWSCADQRLKTVRERLTAMFRKYGLPWRMLADNGAPWGSDGGASWTRLEVWLLKLGVPMSHGRPRHPQTQGKEERFHRTLSAEVLRREDLSDRSGAQEAFDRWRDVYNLERPHEALGLQPPITRYRPSERAFPERTPRLEPSPGETPCRVTEGGRVRLKGRRFYLGDAFDQEIVGLRNEPDGIIRVNFGPYPIGIINPRTPGNRVALVPLGRCAPSLHEHDDVSS